LNDAWRDLVLGYAAYNMERGLELHGKEGMDGMKMGEKEGVEREGMEEEEEARWLSMILRRKYCVGGRGK